MKALILALSLLAGAAHAETITLGSVAGDGHNKVFYNIPNDGGLSLTLYAQPNYVFQNLVINGVPFTGPNRSPATLKDSAGNTVILTATYSSVTKCSGGHPVCYSYWTLTGGTVQR